MTSPGGYGATTAVVTQSGGNGLAGDVHTLERALFEVKRIIVGQDILLERILVGLLAKGHVLLEGVPGVAKTLLVKTLAQAVSPSLGEKFRHDVLKRQQKTLGSEFWQSPCSLLIWSKTRPRQSRIALHWSTQPLRFALVPKPMSLPGQSVLGRVTGAPRRGPGSCGTPRAKCVRPAAACWY